MQSVDNPSHSGALAVIKEEMGRADGIGAPRRLRKVFFLVDSLNVGGTETQAVELACRLDPQRYEATLGCLRARGPLLSQLQDSRVQVREFYPQGGVDSVRGIQELLRLAWFLYRGGFDIFHSHDLWSNLMGVPAAWLARVPAILCSRRDLGHLDWYQTGKRSWLRRIQSFSDMVVVNASAIRDRLITEEGLMPTKVRVIHNGIAIEKFKHAVCDRARLFPGVGDGKLVVLVGNMRSDVKGHAWLIAAAPAILREFPKTYFVLVGDGNQRSELERRVRELGLQPNFLFLGNRGDVPEILACCDMAVLPSKAEGFSNALLEYMASGLPVVATGVGGNVELVRDNETGLLIPPGDEAALAGAILRLLRDPELARDLAESGRDYVRQTFSYERLLLDVDKLYDGLLARREGDRRA